MGMLCYVQSFEVNDAAGTKLKCYGVKPNHDHGKANQFTKDVLADLKGTYPDVTSSGNFDQLPEPTDGDRQYKYKKQSKKWEKV